MSQGYSKGIPIDTDTQLTLDSDFLVPSQKAVKAYVESYQGSANNAASLGGIAAANYALKIDVVPVANTANLAFDHANAAYAVANTGSNTAILAYGQANQAFALANTANITADLAYDQANQAFARANTANITADIAKANSACTDTAAAFAQANTANITADLAFNKANAANVLAFNALPQTGGTISGDLVVQGNAVFSGLTTYANTQTLLIGDNILALNADLPVDTPPSENAGITINRGNAANADLFWNEATDKWTINDSSGVYLNIASNTDVETVSTATTAAFGKANNAQLDATAAFAKANTAGTDAVSAFTTANVAFSNANTVMISSAVSFGVANQAFAHANASFANGNTNILTTASAYGHANLAYAKSNTSNITADLAYGQANQAFAKANSALANTTGAVFNGVLNVSDSVNTQGLNVTSNVINFGTAMSILPNGMMLIYGDINMLV
jgi:hypothetical protein